MAPDLRANILTFYEGATDYIYAKTPKAIEKEKTDWAKLQDQLTQLRASEAAEADAAP